MPDTSTWGYIVIKSILGKKKRRALKILKLIQKFNVGFLLFNFFVIYTLSLFFSHTYY